MYLANMQVPCFTKEILPYYCHFPCFFLTFKLGRGLPLKDTRIWKPHISPEARTTSETQRTSGQIRRHKHIQPKLIPKLEQQPHARIEAIQGIRSSSLVWAETLYSTTGYKIQKARMERKTNDDNTDPTKINS